MTKRSLRVKIVSLREEGLTFGKIAKRLGVSRSLVAGQIWRRANGALESTAHHWTPDDDVALVAYRESGLTFREIGERMGHTMVSTKWRYYRVTAKAA